MLLRTEACTDAAHVGEAVPLVEWLEEAAESPTNLSLPRLWCCCWTRAVLFRAAGMSLKRM